MILYKGYPFLGSSARHLAITFSLLALVVEYSHNYLLLLLLIKRRNGTR
jgi:hypothetical protein